MNIKYTEKIKQFDDLMSSLLKLKSVSDYYFKKCQNEANTNKIENLTKLGIKRCLLCDKVWNNTDVIPNNSHNFSESLILKPLSENNKKVFVANKTRPFTIIEHKRNNIFENLKPKDFLENIENTSTFGGICHNCDDVYNQVFERDYNLDFKNKKHLDLFVERSSLFKYYRELRITAIINNMLNIKDKYIAKEDSEKYKQLKEKIKCTNIQQIRAELFSKEKVIFSRDDNNIHHRVYEDYDIKDKMFSDYYDIFEEDITLINLVILNKKSYLIVSGKNEKKLEIVNKDLYTRIDNIDFKDVIMLDIFKESPIKDMKLHNDENSIFIKINNSALATICINDLDFNEFKSYQDLSYKLDMEKKELIFYYENDKDENNISIVKITDLIFKTHP